METLIIDKKSLGSPRESKNPWMGGGVGLIHFRDCVKQNFYRVCLALQIEREDWFFLMGRYFKKLYLF